MKRRGRSGITLLELLIAITLVSLLCTGMLFAVRSGLIAMEAFERRTGADRRSAGARRILENQFAAFMPVVVSCSNPEAPPQAPGMPTAFFQGEPGVMRFVTAYSLEEGWRGAPRVIEYFIVARDDEQGYRLLANEIPYTGPYGTGRMCTPPQPTPDSPIPLPRFAPPQPGPKSFVVADKLAYCRFLYLAGKPDPLPDLWLPRWVFPREWPRAVRIEMAPSRFADASRLPPMDLTARLHVTRPPFEELLGP